MPEPTGAATIAADPAEDRFFAALDGLLDSPDPARETANALDVPVERADPVATDDPSATPDASDTPDDDDEPADEGPPAAPAGATPPSPSDPASDDPGPDGRVAPATSRRAAHRDLEETRSKLSAAEARIAELEQRAPESAGLAVPSASRGGSGSAAAPPAVADDQAARDAVMDFLGMAPPRDEDGQVLAGEEPIFTRLDRAAKSDAGIEFNEDQRRYSELSERGAMVGTVYALARKVAWNETAGHLIDPEVGLDLEAVNRAGSIPGWKAAYRQALERTLSERVTSGHQTELAAAQAETARVKAELEAQLAEANKKLQDQSGTFTSRLARARGERAPLDGGRAAVAVPTAAHFESSGDLTADLADWLREAR
jgi:hypothetical protein